MEDAEKTVALLGNTSVATLGGFEDEFTGSGENLVIGFLLGVENKQDDVGSAAWNIGRNFLEELQRSLDENSPSKETAEIGEYAGLSLVRGLRDMLAPVENTAKGMDDSAMNGLRRALSGVDALAGTDFDYAPVIRPVLDLSEIQNGASQISHMLDTGPAYNLAAANGVLMNERAASLDRQSQQSDNIEVLHVLRGLRDDFAGLSGDNDRLMAYLDHYLPELGNMKIVMDSGALVGQMAPKMNEWLGQMTVRQRRQ